jgi:hypothetical protein
LWITNNQRNIGINFHQDFVAGMHSDFFQGQMDREGPFSQTILGETWLSKQK